MGQRLMTAANQRAPLSIPKRSPRKTKCGEMMILVSGLWRGGDRRSQNWRLNQSVNQLEESPAERRAGAAVFSSQFESAGLHIQIEPLFDWKPISTGNSLSISRATEMDFERTNFLKVLR